MEKYLSVKEAAKILGKSVQYVWFLIQAGRLKAQKISTVYIILLDDLQEYQQGLKCKQVSNSMEEK